MIAVVDYHKGNLKSVERGLACAGADARITDDIDVIAGADGIVLPGVGAFADASAALFELGQAEVIRRRIDEGVPFLGICLGLHLMFEEGEEGEQVTAEDEEPLRPRGLAIFPGVVGKLPKTDTQGKTYKIPHVGWNTIVPGAGEARGHPVAQTVLSLHETPTGHFGSLSSSFVDTPESPDPDAEEVLEVLIDADTFACPLLAGIKVGEYFYFTHSYAVPTGSFVIAETTHSITFPSVVQYRDVVFGVQFHPEKSSNAGIQVLRNFADIVQGA